MLDSALLHRITINHMATMVRASGQYPRADMKETGWLNDRKRAQHDFKATTNRLERKAFKQKHAGPNWSVRVPVALHPGFRTAYAPLDPFSK